MSEPWKEQAIRSERPRFECSGISHLVATPDGAALIALDGMQRLHRFDIASRTSSLLTTEPLYRISHDLAALPDGRILLLSSYSTTAAVHVLEGSALVPLVEPAGAGELDMRDGVAAFAPGCGRCVFFTKRQAHVFDIASGTCCETRRFRVGPTESKWTPVEHRLIRTPAGGLMAALGDKPPVPLVGPPMELPAEVAGLGGLSLSRDGNLALGRGADGLELYRLRDGEAQLVASRPGFYGAAALCPDGELWATVEDTAVILRDTTTGAPIDAEQGLPPLSMALHLALASGEEGQAVVLASDGKTVWRHEREADGAERTIALPELEKDGVTSRVDALHLSADGRRMAASIGAGRVRLLSKASEDAASSRVIGPALEPDASPYGRLGLASTSPDFTRVAAVEEDGRRVSIFDMATGETRLAFAPEEAAVFALAFSPDGATLIIGSDRIRLRDSRSGREQRRLELGLAASVHAIAASRCGRRLFAGGLVDDDFHHDGAGESVVWLWDLDKDGPGPLRTWRRSPFLRPWLLDDGALLGARHEKGEVWRLDPEADEPTLVHARAPFRSFACTRDGGLMVFGSEDGELTIRRRD